jgi:tetratricopeptide (TPR) repeat protein
VCILKTKLPLPIEINKTMRILIYVALLAATLNYACKKMSPEQKSLQAAIEAYDANPTAATAETAYTSFDTYLTARGFADPALPDLILEMARLASAQNDYKRALGFYKDYLVQYPDRPDQADRLFDAIGIAEKIGTPELNDILYKSFASRFQQDSRSASLTEKVQQKDIAVDSLLKFIGMNMFNDTTFRLNEEKAHLYIDACQSAVMANPTLPNAPEFLHRAAETARTLRDVPMAIELYDWIIEKYPTNPRASTSLFLKAFTYDNDLNDFASAGKYYNEFLSKYPNNEYAESAKFLLENLGKSDEELMKIIDNNKDAKDQVE